MEELATVTTAVELGPGAMQSLSDKNTLTSADADVIDQAFRGKMQSVGRIEDDYAGSLAPNQEEADKFDRGPIIQSIQWLLNYSLGASRARAELGHVCDRLRN